MSIALSCSSSPGYARMILSFSAHPVVHAKFRYLHRLPSSALAQQQYPPPQYHRRSSLHGAAIEVAVICATLAIPPCRPSVRPPRREGTVHGIRPFSSGATPRARSARKAFALFRNSVRWRRDASIYQNLAAFSSCCGLIRILIIALLFLSFST